MTASLSAKVNGTQGALQVNGVDALVFDAAGLVSGLKPASITPALLSGGQGGNAPAFAARAWCVFNGTLAGTNAPTAGGNVASVTRDATGVFTVNFLTPMPDANYCTVTNARELSNSLASSPMMETGSDATKVKVAVWNSGSGAALNATWVFVVVFR